MQPIGQTLYAMTLPRGPQMTRPARPLGRLVWVHLGRGLNDNSISGLVTRLRDDHGLQVLVTGETAAELRDTLPADHPRDVADFLAHWSPDAIVLTGGDIRPALIAAARGIPIFLIDATAPQLPRPLDAWIPGLLRRAVRGLRAIVTVDGTTARAYRKLGAPQVSRLGGQVINIFCCHHDCTPDQTIAYEFFHDLSPDKISLSLGQ